MLLTRNQSIFLLCKMPWSFIRPALRSARVSGRREGLCGAPYRRRSPFDKLPQSFLFFLHTPLKTFALGAGRRGIAQSPIVVDDFLVSPDNESFGPGTH